MTAVRGQVLRDSLLFLTAYGVIVAAVIFG
jgi:hypothetical protein